MIDHHIIEFGYSLFPIASVVFIGFAVRLLIQNNLSRESHIMLTALLFGYTAAGIRVGWFAVSRLISPRHDSPLPECSFIIHHPLMWDVKWIMALVTGTMFVASVMMFRNIFEPYTKRTFILTIGFIFGMAFLWAWI